MTSGEYWSFLCAAAVLAVATAWSSRATVTNKPLQSGVSDSCRSSDERRRVQDSRIQEQGRGRRASTPSEIPARGWKDILLRVYNNLGEDRVLLVAAGVTFYSLLAIFPAIAALVALYGLFADPANIASLLDAASGVLPNGVLDVIRDQMNRVASQGHTRLGLAFIIGFLVSLWSANAGMKSIFDALNLVYNEPEKRSFVKLNLISLAFTIAAILFVLLAIGCIVALPTVFSSTGTGGAMALVARIVRWPILLIVIGLALAIIYRYGPSRREPKWRWITWGGAFAAVGWIIVSILFSLYTTHFADYTRPMAHSGRSLHSCFGCGWQPSSSSWVPRSMPKWSIRPFATRRPVRRNRLERVGRRWLTRLALLRTNHLGGAAQT
jgi:membrane protein